MRKSMIMYETYYGTSKKTAETFALILGSAKVKNINEDISDISGYDNLILIFSFHGFETGEKIKAYLDKHKEELKEKRVALIGVGLSIKDLDNYIVKINKDANINIEYIGFVSGEIRIRKLTQEDSKVLEEFLKKINMPFMDMGKFKLSEACAEGEKCSNVINKGSKIVEKEELLEEINSFILKHNTCALATGDGKYIRCTPIEYAYYNNKFYIITEGGKKFIGILQNDRVSLSIFNKYIDMSNIKGLQVTGKAKLVSRENYEYEEIMKLKGVQLGTLEKLDIDMNLIRIEVEKFEYLNSNFKKKGYDIKQIINFNF